MPIIVIVSINITLLILTAMKINQSQKASNSESDSMKEKQVNRLAKWIAYCALFNTRVSFQIYIVFTIADFDEHFLDIRHHLVPYELWQLVLPNNLYLQRSPWNVYIFLTHCKAKCVSFDEREVCASYSETMKFNWVLFI